MKIKTTLLIIALLFLYQSASAVCPAGKVQSVQEIKLQIEKQLNPIMEYIFFSQTPTGFVISINKNLIFNECDDISLTGKLLLIQMAQIIKNSGYKWQIFCHCGELATQIERISRTTEQAVKITYFLTDTEKCLLNQIIPIGFGSIMPVKNLSEKQSQNRVDFIVEDFSFSR